MAETGHAKKYRTFRDIDRCLHRVWRHIHPSNGDLTVDKLQNKLDESNAAMDNVSSKNASQDLAETGHSGSETPPFCGA